MNPYEASGPEEAAFLSSYNPEAYPGVGLTSDILAFTIRGGRLSILLIERGDYPYKGFWALPGGFINPNETPEQGARRELAEETGLDVREVHLEQLKTYGTPGRDPRMRVISIAHVALLPDLPTPVGGDDAAQARFFPVEDLDLVAGKGDLDSPGLAFDHAQIIADGLERVRSKFEYTPLATEFLDETFTLADLRRIYETVWGIKLHAANFRRKVLSTPGFVEEVGSTGASTTGGRTAALYRAIPGAGLLHPALMRPTDEDDQR